MKNIINSASIDPLGAMMLDYLNGEHDSCVEVHSETLEMSIMDGRTMFRSFEEMDELEKMALNHCDGRILDVGAGSGCHSLYLQDRDKVVDALDISPGCIEVMKKRNVKHPLHRNIFSLEGKKYNTILMLMNGIGICGTLDGLNLFLQYLKTILAEGGWVLAESTDLALVNGGGGEFGVSGDRYYGETEFILRYQDVESDPFPWLYVDFNTLETLVEFNAFRCEKIASERGGRYLVRIFN